MDAVPKCNLAAGTRYHSASDHYCPIYHRQEEGQGARTKRGIRSQQGTKSQFESDKTETSPASPLFFDFYLHVSKTL
jgi:hypothetical protein